MLFQAACCVATMYSGVAAPGNPPSSGATESGGCAGSGGPAEHHPHREPLIQKAKRSRWQSLGDGSDDDDSDNDDGGARSGNDDDE